MKLFTIFMLLTVAFLLLGIFSFIFLNSLCFWVTFRKPVKCDISRLLPGF